MLTFDEYQISARRTQDHNITPHSQLDHALYGLSAETGEVLGCFQKIHQGHPLNMDELTKEMGDVLWFLAELSDCVGVHLSSIAAGNIEKLKERYPDGFEADRSVNRDKYAENCS